MKYFFTFFTICLLIANSSYAQNSNGAIDVAGDIAFVAYHDSPDGFSFILLDDCPNGVSIIFTDKEWNGSVFENGEGSVVWTNSTGSVISAGTVIDISDANNNPTASQGSAVETAGSGFTTGTANDQIYALIGTIDGNGIPQPGTFLAFVGGLDGGVPATLAGTGLVDGQTAVVIADFEGYYTGSLDCNGTVTDCAAMINTAANWTSGSFTFPGDVPDNFSGTAFGGCTDAAPPTIVCPSVAATETLTVSFTTPPPASFANVSVSLVQVSNGSTISTQSGNGISSVLNFTVNCGTEYNLVLNNTANPPGPPVSGYMASSPSLGTIFSAVTVVGGTTNTSSNFTPSCAGGSSFTADNDAGNCSAVVNGLTATASDDCDTSPDISYTLSGATSGSGSGDASGSTFNVGTTTISYSATDDEGNMSGSCSVTVVVSDTENPMISCPGMLSDAVLDANCQHTLSDLTGSVNASDNCDMSLDITQAPSAGTVLTMPQTNLQIVITATDDDGNSANCIYSLDVVDNADPTAACPANITTNNDPGMCNAVVAFTIPDGSDNCSATTSSAVPSSGSSFNVGTTQVTVTAMDASGNTGTCTFDVTVNDNEDPTANCPFTQTVGNTAGQCGANVNFTLPAPSDNCPGATAASSPASGDFFAVGTTPVTVTATDGAGNTATCSFNITVNDTEDPTANCPTLIAQNNAPGQCGAVSNFTLPTTLDNCPGATATANPASGTFFNVGTTTVTVTATDAAGNTSQCTFPLTIFDVDAPTVTCPNNVTIDTDAGMCNAVVNNIALTASDNCDMNLNISYQTQLNGDEPDMGSGDISGSTFSVGTTTVTYTAEDDAENVGTCSFTVTVEDNTACGCANPQPGDVCDDMDPNTINDMIQADCSCEGMPPCDIALTGTSVMDENCPGANDGSITVSGSCTTCAGIEYSIDGGVNYQPGAMFSGLAPGMYTPAVRDTGDPTCEDIGMPVTVNAGVDTEAPTANCPSPGATNILINNSFENGAAHNTPFNTNWFAFGAVFALDGNLVGSAQDGDFYLKMFGGNSGVFQDHPVMPGDNVNASVYIQNASFDPMLPGCTAFLKLEYFTAGGGFISAVESPMFDNTLPSDVWTQLSFSNVAPAGAATVRFVAIMQCSAGGAVMFDNASLTLGNTGGGDFVLSNDPGQCGAVLNYSIPTPDDNCPGATAVADIPSGSFFDVGTTMVMVTATDASGNTSQCKFNVTVNDTEDPVAECPVPPGGANILINSSFEDGSTHNVPFNSDWFAFGAVFALDGNLVGSAQDGDFYLKIFGGNSGIFQDHPVTPGDNVNASVYIQNASFDPMLPGCTAFLKLEYFTAGGGFISAVESPMFDNTLPSDVWTQLSFSNVAPAGAATVRFVAIMQCSAGGAVMFDNASMSIDNGGTSDFTFVYDPALCGATVSYNLPPSTDNCPGVTTSTNIPSGTFLPVGSSILMVTATDASGNTSSCSVNIEVEDNVPPVIACLDATVDFNGEDQLTVEVADLYDAANTFDNCGPVTINAAPQTVTCDQLGDVIPVTIEGTDASGNVGTCLATITVDGLPCGWMNTDGIGCNGDNDADYDVATETFSLTSDGCTPSFPYIGDSQSFLKYELCGDGYIKAFVDNVNGDGFAGVELRNNLDPGAKKMAIGTNRVNRIIRIARVLDNYPAWPQEVLSYDKFWVKIERSGNYFRAYASVDDVTYIPYLFQAIQMDNCTQVGLFVYSKTGGVVSADFTNVEVVEGTPFLQAEESDVEQSSSIASTFNVGLSPNPAKEEVRIDLSSLIGQDVNIRIFNINGQLMTNSQIDYVEDATEVIAIDKFPAGTYFVNIQTAQQQQTLKLIKQ